MLDLGVPSREQAYLAMMRFQWLRGGACGPYEVGLVGVKKPVGAPLEYICLVELVEVRLRGWCVQNLVNLHKGDIEWYHLGSLIHT